MATCPTCGREAGGAQYCPHDGTPLAHLGRGPAAMPRVGDEVDGGRYTLLEKLGKGGMAVVFLARSEALDREVALKVLYPRWAEDRKTVTRFAREARAASQIDHDNVVKVYDFGYAPEGYYFLAMERLDGRPLAELLRTRLRTGRGIHLLLEIADGVARAHELGVVHRDLKPDNVMVRQAGGRELVTIVDFGLSKIQSGEAAVTGEGDVIGTPDYMAPEQWQGSGVGTRADVYSWGVMAYEILSGELPFGGDSLIQKLQQHLYAVPLALRDHPRVEDLPEGLSDLVTRCMAKDPADRPPHMGVVLAKLGEIDEASRATSAEPTRVGVGPAAAGAAPFATVMAPVGIAQLGRLGLMSEVRRLQRVRQSRLAEIILRVFAGDEPAEVAALVATVGDLERDLDVAEEELALGEASLQEAQRAHRAKEAELRARLVEANLELAVARQALPDEVTDAGERDADTIAIDAEDPGDAPPSPGEASTAVQRLKSAEERLATFVRAADPAVAEAERRFDTALARSQAAEGPLAAIYRDLEAMLPQPDAGEGGAPAELSQIDQAIASYRSRLDVLERQRKRAP